MVAVTQPITIETGTDFAQGFQLRQGAKSTDLLADLAGGSGRAQLRTQAGGDLLATFAVEIDPGQSLVWLRLSHALTAALLAEKAVYDCIYTDASGIETRIVQGAATIIRSVTE